MKELLLPLVIIIVFALGYLVMKRIDTFLESNRKEIDPEHKEKMFFENQLKAINLEKDIIEYEIIDNKLYKNNKLYIDFECDFGDFLKQNIPDQTLLKEELINNIRKYYL